MIRFLLTCCFFISNAYAFSWQDLWLTPDQQAQRFMQAGQFAKAQTLFQQPDWQATAAFRAGDYKQAAQQFASRHSEQGYYNQGNALAKQGQYENAIQAYDKALSLNPSNDDATFNRKLVESLLKKNENNQQDQDKQPNDKQSQDKKDSNQKGNEDKNNPQNNDSKDREKQGSKEQNDDQQNQESNNQAEHSQNARQADKQDKKTSKQDKQPSDSTSQKEREEQQAKEQWLKLIPDDPGGLMREKFLRDYLRRQRGWSQ